jgi:hypothetical protein
MRKLFKQTLATILLAVMITPLLMGAYLETSRQSVTRLRSEVNAVTDSPMSIGNRLWSFTGSHKRQVSKRWNAVVLTFTANADNITCTDAEVWTCTKGGVMNFRWRGVVTAGAQYNDAGEYIADTIETTLDGTIGGVTITGGTAIDVGASSLASTAQLEFDMGPDQYITVRFPTVPSGAMNCDIDGY